MSLSTYMIVLVFSETRYPVQGLTNQEPISLATSGGPLEGRASPDMDWPNT